MMYGDNWSEGVMPDELKEAAGGRIEGYYRWKLKTGGTGYAHIFFWGMESQRELEENWKKVIDGIAVYVQSEVPGLLERSNFYVWFFVEGAVKKELIKEIEDNTYSSRKFVVPVRDVLSVEERLSIAEKKIFSFEFVVPKSDHPMITRVEFQNFRVYKGKKIFDFVRGGEPARLVVLFAPNGMGKTSFFDGIEWGLSGSVGRFAQIADKNTDGREVLRNTEAREGEPAYVKICQQDSGWVERTVSKINHQTKRDYGAGKVQWSEKNPLRRYLSDKKCDIWGNLILPHSKIDGFIAGMKPTALYKEWGGLWDAGGEKRKAFEEVYGRKRAEEKQCGEMRDAYIKKQKEYDELKKSRDFVQKLEQNVKHFRGISGSTFIEEPDFSTISADGYLEWINLVDSQSDVYEKQIRSAEEKSAYLDRDIRRDMDTYRSLLKEEKKAAAEQKTAEMFLTQCRRKSRLLRQSEEQKSRLEKLGHEIRQTRFVYEKGEGWYADAARYPDAGKRRGEIAEMLSAQKERVFSLEREGERLALEVIRREKERGEEREYRLVLAHAEELAENRRKQEKLAAQKADCDVQISGLGEQIRKCERGLSELEECRIESLKKAEERYGKGNAAVWEDADAQLGQISAGLVGLVKKYHGLEEKLSCVTQQIAAEEQAEERVRKLVAESRALIGERALFCCPVCQTPFADVQDLLAHTYRVTSGEGADRVSEKQKLETELSETGKRIEEEISRYHLRLEKLADWLREKRAAYQKSLSKKETEKENIEKEYEALDEREWEIQKQDQERGIFVIYQGKGIASWRELWNAKLDKEIAETREEAEKNARQKADGEGQIIVLQKALEDTDDLILRMEKQSAEDYARMREAEAIIKSRAYAALEDRIRTLTIESENLEKRYAECSRQLRELQDVPVSLEADYEKKCAQAQSRQEEAKRKAAFVRKRVEEGLAAELPGEEGFSAVDFDTKAEERKQALLKEKEEAERCMEALGKLKYNKEAENYFRRWAEVSGQIEKAKEAYEAAERRQREARECYRLAKIKIEEEMADFLERYRMGEIYEKLEPHEKLKRLVAEFSFDEKEQPGLSFGVVGEDQKTYPPAWFLSTAQLNVVAFAIFLGRALQMEDVPLKSIFIDDPIGHFDEMNIVGFVDLLRNILENTDRQLIISTHEERVFGLIRRKIPEEDYPACYIDFREKIRYSQNG